MRRLAQDLQQTLRRGGGAEVRVAAVAAAKLSVRLPGRASEGGSVADWAWEGVVEAAVQAIAARPETLWSVAAGARCQCLTPFRARPAFCAPHAQGYLSLPHEDLDE